MNLKDAYNVDVFNICDLIDREGWNNLSYDELTLAVTKWMEKNDAIYYADIRENFSNWEARKKAVNAGKSKVVVEDLS